MKFSWPTNKFRQLLSRSLFKVDVYKLNGNDVIPARNPTAKFGIQDVCSWHQVFISIGVSFILIKFPNERTEKLSDTYGELYAILKNRIPEKETLWKAMK